MTTVVRALRVVAASVGFIISVLILITATRVNKLEKRWLHYALDYPYYLLASGAVSLGTIPILFLIGYLKKGAFLATVLVDMCWFGVLTILWLIGGLLTQQAIKSTSYFDCTVLNQLTEEEEFEQEFEDLKSICTGYSTFRTTSFIACSVFFIYSSCLLILGTISTMKGRSIWLSPVTSPGFYRPPPHHHSENGRYAPQAPKRSEMETVHVPRSVSVTNTMDTLTNSPTSPIHHHHMNLPSTWGYNDSTIGTSAHMTRVPVPVYPQIQEEIHHHH
ncbi:hypothetical protein BDN72DRAFT_402069 [Pluteus cervinus]|uniref:Uncharacterized protein n=1 Tax=Pluteus cervinus TaxID=181527 RepID=A0ACD3B2S7_9AGAR|nr:hypothetical protein BDN72DRAFT_402069 [Pluteus cervinus]